jgi:hypothetical protein
MRGDVRRSRFDQSEAAAPSEEPSAKRAAVDGAAGVAPAAAAPKPNLEAIQKAKAALQKHKELAAKLKSMPQLAAMAAAKAAAAKTAAGAPTPPALAKVRASTPARVETASVCSSHLPARSVPSCGGVGAHPGSRGRISAGFPAARHRAVVQNKSIGYDMRLRATPSWWPRTGERRILNRKGEAHGW